MVSYEQNAAQSNKNAFLEHLYSVQENLTAKGIDYRIVGSVASHAYLEGADFWPQTFNYDRPNAATPDQRIPDIDLMVARDDLPAVNDIRKNFLKDAVPIKIGIGRTATDIDFRPDEDESFLTNKDILLPVQNTLLAAHTETFGGVDLSTVPLDTLIHTYSTFGGMVRHKDVAILRALIKLRGESTDHASMEPFHTFQKLRRKRSPMEYRRARVIEYGKAHLPPVIRKPLHRVALAAIHARNQQG